MVFCPHSNKNLKCTPLAQPEVSRAGSVKASSVDREPQDSLRRGNCLFSFSPLLYIVVAMFSVARKSALRQARTQLRQTQPITVPQYSAFARLLSSLAVLEQRDGKLNPSSLSAVTAAQKLGGSVTALVAGSSIKGVAEEAAKVQGIEKVLFVENGAYDRVSRSIGCSSQILTVA